ncbi:hypothetical protein DIURU_000844 [Diutina rugosa]|uniref:Something about silencing protein 4 domain-containing protein n=1 Tax=Diutina rugosa TaxID=5481 RepID=A0A642UWQ6_DIURU|nr:uncharacterized protein DIURU_000844 [Diutina rugosa]KAA8907160.1 hypothetical protein DIURU_000844 [Diutina rugosa]
MSERRLRSKDERTGSARVLDFEAQNPWIYKNKPIKISRGSTVANPYRYPIEESSATAPAPRPQTITPAKLEPPEVTYDPLTDGNYEKFHRKMMLFEKVRNNEDRSRMLNEFSILEEQLTQLLREDWGRHIHDIVYIHNRSDANEVAFKRDLAIREVMRLLGKFSHWKHRMSRVTSEVKTGEGWPGSFIHDDNYQRSRDEIRSLQTRRWAEEFGSRFRLVLDRNHTVIIDPVKPPVIVNRADQVVGPTKRRFHEFSWTPSPAPVATPKTKRVKIHTPSRSVRKKTTVASTQLVLTNGTTPLAILSRPATYFVTLPVCSPIPIKELASPITGWDSLKVYASSFSLPPAVNQWRLQHHNDGKKSILRRNRLVKK